MADQMSEEFKNQIHEAYEDVRDDGSSTMWCCLKYNGSTPEFEGTGEDFDELKSKFGDEDRCFAYLRIISGDELSKRSKFVFMTWVGPGVSGMKRAKMSTEKSFIKTTWRAFAVEMNFDTLDEVDVETITNEVKSAGGANYGTGQ